MLHVYAKKGSVKNNIRLAEKDEYPIACKILPLYSTPCKTLPILLLHSTDCQQEQSAQLSWTLNRICQQSCLRHFPMLLNYTYLYTIKYAVCKATNTIYSYIMLWSHCLNGIIMVI